MAEPAKLHQNAVGAALARADHSGLLVTLDGPSGAGKTTVSALLTQCLAATGPALLTSQPSESPLGSLARHGTFEYRGLALALLIAADRHHHRTTVIEPALRAGKIVVCDRYMPSSLVLEQLDGVDGDYIAALYRFLPRPDIAFVLADDPDRCRQRAAARGGHSRFHRTEAAIALAEAALFETVTAFLASHGYPIRSVQVAGRGPESVAAELCAAVVAHRSAEAETTREPVAR